MGEDNELNLEHTGVMTIKQPSECRCPLNVRVARNEISFLKIYQHGIMIEAFKGLPGKKKKH